VSSFKALAQPWYTDQILPFDVTLAGTNEYGAATTIKIFGVEILNEGSGVSIDDAVTEMQSTFVARLVEPWVAVKSSGDLVPLAWAAATRSRRDSKPACPLRSRAPYPAANRQTATCRLVQAMASPTPGTRRTRNGESFVASSPENRCSRPVKFRAGVFGRTCGNRLFPGFRLQVMCHSGLE